ncbi:hypothetical protein CDAR_118741 [Caerostris darwini]|uniref:Uncharacterized protein n=1 Tax=Caerostris darwini TaxID=1538125 RepID=A0AAV4TPV6_9ARAC|nr:hypothetical protein CDAR_118741 [Caerostris darwini]
MEDEKISKTLLRKQINSPGMSSLNRSKFIPKVTSSVGGVCVVEDEPSRNRTFTFIAVSCATVSHASQREKDSCVTTGDVSEKVRFRASALGGE